MASSRVQLTCAALTFLGFIGAVVTCSLPYWRVITFKNSHMESTTYMGLWKICAVGNGASELHCIAYSSDAYVGMVLYARPMTVICCLLSGLVLIMLFTTKFQNEDIQPKIHLGCGIMLLVAGLFIIISVSLVAIILFPEMALDVEVHKGACIAIGSCAGVVMLLAGGLLCGFSLRSTN
ncbi:claudin-4-like [Denticeps clupeoides]|uniref:Claudin n=1 Tax=Denticeps clupeoides TaxID=299321 RepID=A0AAY4CDD3_9TELE|nr:claudin-4-like [Denticeps clupeoides]